MRRDYLVEARALARARGGACLSQVLPTVGDKATWRCAEGHTWQARFEEVRKGTWCRACHYASLMPTLEDAQRLAAERRGACLNTAYINKRVKMRWRCAEGHEWEARFSSIRRGTWCPTCFKKYRAGKHLVLKDGLEQARSIAARRGGHCLSDTYSNNATPLSWRCANGHAWHAVLSDIKKGTWCPQCSFGVRERLCRRVLEALLGAEFPRSRPAWLVNERGHGMEFDGYNEALRVAFEHHGEHHYRRLRHFQRREESLARRKRDDARKAALARRHGVKLIEIPFHVAGAELPSWIAAALRRKRYAGTVRAPSTIEFSDSVMDTSLERLRATARERGGECLSTVWLGVEHKHRFRCAQGHEWEATAANVLARTWCPGCKSSLIASKRRNPRGLETMRALAHARGGEFLSTEYTSVNDRHRWRCAEGHTWEAAPSDVQKGTWCRSCAVQAKRDTLGRMREVARARHGECLASEYVDTYTKLRWRCAEGHEWEARPGNVINRGSWCPVCARGRHGTRAAGSRPSR